MLCFLCCVERHGALPLILRKRPCRTPAPNAAEMRVGDTRQNPYLHIDVGRKTIWFINVLPEAADTVQRFVHHVAGQRPPASPNMPRERGSGHRGGAGHSAIG
jgi:hypothetical protein